MEICILQPNQAPMLKELLAWSRPSEAISLARCREMISHSGNWFIVALSKGRPVGLIVGYEIQRFPGDVMFLYEIDVHPDHRQKGVATQMVEFLKTECRRRKLREMFVITNENNVAAMRLYEKTGGKRPHPDDAMFDYDLTKS